MAVAGTIRSGSWEDVRKMVAKALCLGAGEREKEGVPKKIVFQTGLGAVQHAAAPGSGRGEME